MLDKMAAHERTARARLPGPAVDYIASGSWDEVSLGEAVAAWRRHRFAPRVLRDVCTPSTAINLLGAPLAAPVLVAPTGYQRLAHPFGEEEMARGTARAGSLMVVSTRTTTTFEAIGETGCPFWLQVYLLRDRSLTAALVHRAVSAGARALVLTGDTPYVARKGAGLTNLPTDEARRLVRPTAFPKETTEGFAAGAADQDPGATMADIAWLTELSGLPVIVKGVLRPDDALACLHAGAAGVIVSNHGGRQLDRAVATAEALGPIAEAVGDRGLVLVDGGIRDGLSLLAALALGARAVLVGRPALWALAAQGGPGVQEMLEGLQADFAIAMALAGAARVGDIDRSLIARPAGRPGEPA